MDNFEFSNFTKKLISCGMEERRIRESIISDILKIKYESVYIHKISAYTICVSIGNSSKNYSIVDYEAGREHFISLVTLHYTFS